MKLIIQSNRIVGTATDDYNGPDAFLDAPDGFTIDDAGKYIVVDGELVLAVPAQVTMRQARLALHQSGLLANVDLAIAGLDEPAKTTAKIEWEYAQTVDRNAGLVPAMAAALGMTEAQIDDLFRLAGGL